MKQYTIGIDYGTLSGRALLLDAVTGETVATSTLEYPHAVMDRTLPDGTPLEPRSAYQHPNDYLDVLRVTIPDVLAQAHATPAEVVGLGIDFTCCTLLPIREDGTPLCFETQYQSEPHAYVKLWKHHGAQEQADRMTEIAKERGEGWLARYGGRLSSEWAFPKIYETLLKAPNVYDDAFRFIEAGDWLSLLLTGRETHAACFAGLKFCWDDGAGFPSNDYLTAVDPRLSGLIGTKVCDKINTVDEIAGKLTARGAELTGLCEGTALALPGPDASNAMPALGVTAPGTMLSIIGTSGVLLVHDYEARGVQGICGYANRSVVPNLCTYEAGQAGVGDSFDWFVKNCVPAHYTKDAEAQGMNIHKYLRQKASKLRVGESGLLALDWLNGNRSVLQDASLSGLIVGLHIGTRPEEIYRALIESTAFGMRRCMEAFIDGGIRIDAIRATGGIAKKDELLMQIYADVCGREIAVMDTDQGGALGSAIYAAVAAGLYPSVVEAADALCEKKSIVYKPIPENQAAYDKLYAEYNKLYDYFGTTNPVMKKIRQ